MRTVNKLRQIKDSLLFTQNDDGLRMNLNGVLFDKTSSFAVSSNGHCLTFSRYYYINNPSLEGKVFDYNNLVELNNNFPNVSIFVSPKLNKFTMYKISIDKVFYTKDKDPVKRRVFINTNGSEYLTLSLEKSDKTIACIDGRYLKPVANGQTLTVYIKDSLSPIYFDFLNGIGELQECFLLMPINLDK